MKALLPCSWLSELAVRPTTTYAASSADSDRATPRVPRRRPEVNGGTASAPSTATVECEDRPATEPTRAESRTSRRVRGISSISPAVTAAQMAPMVKKASSISWSCDRSKGIANVSNAKVRAPTASQVYCRRGLPQIIGPGHLAKESMMWMTAGPITAMNRHGRMQKISGMVIFTGTFWAFSSARWRRLTRIS